MPYMKVYCNHCEKEHEVSSVSSLACPTCFINMKAERDNLRSALEGLYSFVLKDEAQLIAALRSIQKELEGRRWMADMGMGTNGLSFDEFRVEVGHAIDTIESRVKQAETDSYPKYDDAMIKAHKALNPEQESAD